MTDPVNGQGSHSPFNVAGKIALVTGGSKGIGAMIAEGLVKAGATTFITSRNVEQCTATVERLSAFGRCEAVPGDLSTLLGIEAFISGFELKAPQLDILVNNAGASWGEPMGEFSERGWDKVIDLNLKSVFFLVQKLLPMLQFAASEIDPGRIINIASVSGLKTSRVSNYSYVASKAGLIHLTRQWATDLASDRITVNAIAPGYFPTDMTALMDDDQKRILLKNVPLRRPGSPPDISGPVQFLASSAGAYVTGTCIPVDGGMVAFS